MFGECLYTPCHKYSAQAASFDGTIPYYTVLPSFRQSQGEVFKIGYSTLTASSKYGEDAIATRLLP
jgi:hypothetical protein